MFQKDFQKQVNLPKINLPNDHLCQSELTFWQAHWHISNFYCLCASKVALSAWCHSLWGLFGPFHSLKSSPFHLRSPWRLVCVITHLLSLSNVALKSRVTWASVAHFNYLLAVVFFELPCLLCFKPRLSCKMSTNVLIPEGTKPLKLLCFNLLVSELSDADKITDLRKLFLLPFLSEQCHIKQMK